MNKPQVSISIVNYRTFSLTAACIRSIISQTHGLTYEIFVVDNNSSDNSIYKINKLFGSRIKIINNLVNVGFAAAHNQVIGLARGKYLLLLNSDTVISNNAIKIMVEELDGHPRWGIGCPQLLNQDNTPQRSYTCFRTPLERALWEFKSPMQKLGLLTSPSPTAHFPKKTTLIDRPRGVCFLIKSACIQEIGLLDERFFMYDEEVDWSLRAIKAGWKNVFIPTALVIHIGGGSSYSPQLNLVHQFSDYQYFVKHFGIYAAVLIRLGAIFGGCLWTILAIMYLFKLRLEKSKEALMHSQKSLQRALITYHSIDWQKLK